MSFKRIISIVILIIFLFPIFYKVQAKYNYKYSLHAFSIFKNASKKSKKNNVKVENNSNINSEENIEFKEENTSDNQIESNNDVNLKYVIIKHKKMKNKTDNN